MIKWPEKQPVLTTDFIPGAFAHNDNGKQYSRDHKAEIWNNAVDACRAALDEACERGTIQGIVAQGWCTEKNKHKEMDADLVFAIADAIRRHLGLEDK